MPANSIFSGPITSTFNVSPFRHYPSTRLCKKEKRKKKKEKKRLLVFLISHYYWSFSSDIMAVKGLICKHPAMLFRHRHCAELTRPARCCGRQKTQTLLGGGLSPEVKLFSSHHPDHRGTTKATGTDSIAPVSLKRHDRLTERGVQLRIVTEFGPVNVMFHGQLISTVLFILKLFL